MCLRSALAPLQPDFDRVTQAPGRDRERPGRTGDNRQPAPVPCDGSANRHELTP
jgi:hypothetical protein